MIDLNLKYPMQGFGRPAGLRGGLALMQYYNDMARVRAGLRAAQNQSKLMQNRSHETQDEPPPETPALEPAPHTEQMPEVPVPDPVLHTEPIPEVPEPEPELRADPIPEIPISEPAQHTDPMPDVPASEPVLRAEYIPEVPEPVFIPIPASAHAPRPRGVFRRRECGLLRYKKFWFLREADIRVHGETLTGTPIYIKSNTLRVVNATHSYYIPLEKIDYIRTDDGYRSVFEDC